MNTIDMLEREQVAFLDDLSEKLEELKREG